MNILVCVKPVPDPEKYGELKIDGETKRLIREGIPTVVNPSDRNALEEALRLREEHGGKVTVLSMAPEFSRDKLVECLAMGADEAYLVSDRIFGGADTYATSYVLAKAAEKLGSLDLILMGNESADGATAHVPVQLAEWLGLPHLCRVCSVEATGEGFRAVKKGDEGRLVFGIRKPCVLAVSSDINKPRYVNAMGLIKARKKPLTIWSNEDLALDEEKLGLTGSPTKAGELISPDMKRGSESLGKDPEEIAGRIAELIRKAGV
ncbi:MAG: electron transfer flavoprotein subunit beta/FixA family protein [Clostridiales bacterium]|nr:electron transfer flavoprotein subunit beta/FixA family protein [Clostridiales bacterium]MDD7034897.1 electron transfer flavoprotein subunit beta/FixA family protein [Bacillota bacterium]MDY2920342.1 electron transfer flavoprotein subunit beta/FixA family protein [Lentihominibacter sp.]